MEEMQKMIPPERLRTAILLGIHKEERQRARRYLLASSVATFASFSGIALSVRYAVGVFYTSNVYQYFLLLFSDMDIVFAYWREFLWSFFESAPLLPIIVVCGALLFFLLSFRSFITHMRSVAVPFLAIR